MMVPAGVDPEILARHAKAAARRDAASGTLPGVTGENFAADWRDSKALRAIWRENRTGFITWAKFQTRWGRSYLAPCPHAPNVQPTDFDEPV